MKLVGHLMTWLFHRCTDQFEIFSRFLAKVELDFWCIRAWDIKKKTREMDTTLSIKASPIINVGIGIWSIFDTVFRYLPIAVLGTP